MHRPTTSLRGGYKHLGSGKRPGCRALMSILGICEIFIVSASIADGLIVVLCSHGFWPSIERPCLPTSVPAGQTLPTSIEAHQCQRDESIGARDCPHSRLRSLGEMPPNHFKRYCEPLIGCYLSCIHSVTPSHHHAVSHADLQ